MKKIIFFIALITFGFSFGTNHSTRTDVIDVQIIDSDCTLKALEKEDISKQFDFNSAVVFEVDCAALGVAVFDAAIEKGYSTEDAYDMGLAAGQTCVALKLIGGML